MGQFNNGTQRTICCGPGLQEWDFSVHKKITVTESTYLQFRAEIFNVFNHTEFLQPGRPLLGRADPFGKITQASDPREVQFALKYYF